MAETLRILVSIDNTYDQMSLQEIHDQLINNELFDLLPGKFDYFSLRDVEDECYFGKDHPEWIVKEAKEWNRLINTQFEDAYKQLQRKALDKTLPFTKFIETHPNDLSVWEFKNGICAISGSFQYGMNSLVIEHSGGFTDYVGPYMSQDVLQNIEKHPENYAIIECYYH